MPRNAVVSVGILVGAAPDADLWDFCGARRGFRRLTHSAVQGLRDSGFVGRFAVRPEWLAGLPCSAR